MAYETAQTDGIESANVSEVIAEVARRFDVLTVERDSIELDFIRGAYLAERACNLAATRDSPDVSADEVDALASAARRVAEGQVARGHASEVSERASALAFDAGLSVEELRH